ncbi:MAG: Hsp33 family molecular chaperone HslO [Kofleriaceae bacterium]|nr:Hsp33 family molecular chaperone HslO [Kofleriaceae bacterium]MCL4225180.1 Hsp33 family molecular chaperone HslO [Myxococcales bacterium]
MSSSDQVVRLMTMDGAFRLIAAVTTETARGALASQATGDELGLRLAELLTAAVLVRETTQPTRRVQMVWRDRRGRSLVADSLPDGLNRGLVNPGDSAPVAADGEHLLQVNYTLTNGALHQGLVAVADGDDMATALMRYMKQSEQIVSMIAVAALPGPGGVRAVGGYVVQLLPEATREVITAMTDHLGNLEPMAILLEGRGRTAAELARTVFAGFEHAELATSSLRFGCTCSEVRVMTSILTLAPDEVESMLGGDPLEVRCDACGTQYRITPEALRAFRDQRVARA